MLPLETGSLGCESDLLEDSTTEFGILVDGVCNSSAPSKNLADKRRERIWVGDNNRDKTGLNRIAVDKQLKSKR